MEFLKAQAKSTWGLEMSPELEKVLLPTAEAMVAVSAAEIPEDAEPLLV
jgi:hypothetical protein